MVNQSTESDAVPPGDPDANGKAAILLVESLIHVLVARAVISLEDAVDVVQDAIDVRSEMAREIDIATLGEDKSVHLLAAISDSLRIDIRHEPVTHVPPIG